MTTSFFYEDLISHVQSIQKLMVKVEHQLSDQSQGDKKQEAKLKARSFTFIDPHGNPIVTEHLDHQSIGVVIKKFVKEYIPKYLQGWIKIGTINPQKAFKCDEVEMKSFVHQYPDGQQFVAYGQITGWIVDANDSWFEPLRLCVQLSDSMEKIKSHVRRSRLITADLELRLSLMESNAKPKAEDWYNGKQLQANDTIMLCKFYEKNRHLLLSISTGKVNNDFLFLLKFIFLSRLPRRILVAIFDSL